MNILDKLAVLAGDHMLLAALDDTQKKHVNKLKIPHHSFSDHAMGGPDKHRSEIPLEKHDIIPNKKIVERLGEKGYHAVNYTKGLVKDKHGREVKIGKILNKHPDLKHLVHTYENDPERSAHGEHKIVISRHPHDVAGMSTNQGWTSCMDLNKNYDQKRHLKKDLTAGTHVAYLVHKDDHDLQKPIARIALKPHTSENGHKVLVPESKTYGTANSSFHKTVSAWTKKHFPMHEDTIYHKDKEVYNDSHKIAMADPHKFVNKVANDPETYNKYKKLLTHHTVRLAIVKHSKNKSILNHVLKYLHEGHLDKEAVHNSLKVGLSAKNHEKFHNPWFQHRDAVTEYHKNKAAG